MALVGKTNVGKSSMLNAFLGKERAIVTDIAGTTRDVIEESVEVGGIKITFTDTAGISESDDVVEKVGIEKAKSELKSSDIVLYVVDVEDKEKDEEFEKLLEGKKVIRVVNKIDKVEDSKDFEDGVIPVSCKTGENVKKVLDEIVNAVSEGKVTSGGETVVLKRHYQAIVEAKKSIDEVYYNYDMMDNCLRLMELKNAWNKLGEVTGTTAMEDIIDAIFSKFCLGK